MSIFTVLYNLLIGPLELMFEIVFALANRVINNPGFSIIFLSLAVNFLIMPLYKQADAMQEEARLTEQKLSPWVSHIKKNFKGDERFMMLQTYYRQNHYKPTDALKGSVSLLLEVPFFMAAYNFLSKLQMLNGASLGPIQNLGAPDGMLVIGSVAINILPILMTLINFISGAIYTKGFPMKQKVQLYGMALVFLVLLYDSPSGLVFYWTLNNVFSLGKNIFAKLKNAKFKLAVLFSVTGVGLLGWVTLLHPMETMRKQMLVIALLLMLQLPLILQVVRKHMGEKKTVSLTKDDTFIFFAGCVFMTALTGLLIPSTVIKTSTAEFINVVTHTNPVTYVLSSVSLAAGAFLIWFGIFYMLASPESKKRMSCGIWVLSGIAVVNYMFFGTNYGNLSPMLRYDNFPGIPLMDQAVNLLVVLAVVGVLYLIWKKKEELVKVTFLAAGIAVFAMSMFHVWTIHSTATKTVDQIQSNSSDVASIPLSKNGKNVVVLMMDRGISSYVPYMMNEKPELREQFAGFTYYPNTISFGGYTNFGTPALYGGYEYTPEQMNRRADEKLEDKHNEALKVMPRIFSEADFETTVCDPSYAGYNWIPDLSIFDEYPKIHSYNTVGKFNADGPETAAATDALRNRNFFCYSLFRIAPVFCQPTLYSQGLYNDADALYAPGSTESVQVRDGIYKATGTDENFNKTYSVLTNMTKITDVGGADGNTFLMMANETPHEPMLLSVPNYEPAAVVDNTAYEKDHQDRYILDGRQMKMENEQQVIHYQTNMASMIQVGKWLDYLRENDVYDNTRIIIVSDHGRPLRQFDDMLIGDGYHEDVMFYNALLMVKDFGSTEFTIDQTFMTNGDVPTLATAGLIENPVNPFSGKPINSDAKYAGEQHVFVSELCDTNTNCGNTFLPGLWYAVKDNIFDLDNWVALGDHVS